MPNRGRGQMDGAAGGGEPVGTEDDALATMRARLEEAISRARLTKTRAAARSGIGRTTLHEALREGAPAPTATTLVALATGLNLTMEERAELLRLRRTATSRPSEPAAAGLPGPQEDDYAAPPSHRPDGFAPTRGAAGPGLGRPIGECDPHLLEVHPAGTSAARNPELLEPVLSGYVRRAHDARLALNVEAARAGRSRMVVLVGSSSTGKTRACWEAIQPLADEGWRVWHPQDPSRAQAALAGLPYVGPRTVVWLNEAQHYLGDERVGESIAAAVHSLLAEPERAPVLVLGTLWREHSDEYTALPAPGGTDPHSRVRELLAGRTVPVPDVFDPDSLAQARTLARQGDRLLSEALTGDAGRGRLAQHLAGAPELLRRYEEGSPFGRALLRAAMDARRLGAGPRLARAFLIEAATDYMADEDWDDDVDGLAASAFAELSRQVHGKQAALQRVDTRPRRRPSAPSGRAARPAPAAEPIAAGEPVFLLADSLEQYGRTARRFLCPPASFWHAAAAQDGNPKDTRRLAEAAMYRHRLQWGEHLLETAARAGDSEAAFRLGAACELRGDLQAAEAMYQIGADTGHAFALRHLFDVQEKAGNHTGAEASARREAGLGRPGAFSVLAGKRAEAGDLKSAKALYGQAVEAGDLTALTSLGRLLVQEGDLHGAEAAFQRAGAAGDARAWFELGGLRENAGNEEEAEALYQRAGKAGMDEGFARLAVRRARAGDPDGADALFARMSRTGGGIMLYQAQLRREAGDEEGEAFHAKRAAKAGRHMALVRLMHRYERAGNRAKMSELALVAATTRRGDVLEQLVYDWETEGAGEEAEVLARQAAAMGHPQALRQLSWLRRDTDEDGRAAALHQKAADAGDPFAMAVVARRQWWKGDREKAELLADGAAVKGEPFALVMIAEVHHENGDSAKALSLYRRAAEADSRALERLAEERNRRSPEEAEGLAHRVAAAGHSELLSRLAQWRVEAGDTTNARRLYQAAVDAGDSRSIARLARLYEEAGETTTARALYLRAADAGHVGEDHARIWPYGLDPDGEPTPHWR
ncbi:hypothetical protein ACIQEY_11720 [Streptomyces parvus]|uniref:hypothetical protein n=1 Tax=Streptomyces parvus TaxID=66428 RepID=UPI0038155A3A